MNGISYSIFYAMRLPLVLSSKISLICLGPNQVYNVHNPSGIDTLIMLCLGLINLHDHTFSHDFSDYLDELCICGTDIESTNHFLFQCLLSLSERQTFMEKICNVEILILDQKENFLCYTLLFGSDKLNDVKNLCILNATIEYILLTERSSVSFSFYFLYFYIFY